MDWTQKTPQLQWAQGDRTCDHAFLIWEIETEA